MPTRLEFDRRRLLVASAGLGLTGPTLAGCAINTAPITVGASPVAPPLFPIRTSPDRLFDITVCLRPFRTAGPRLDVERIGDTTVVHNYGHGGSGWSLSWGSAAQAVRLAMASSPKRVAVIGCGAIGLTSAITAQEAGAQVTIYARDLLPATRSARATGSWTPDSRIALASAPPAFADRWEEMARIAWKAHRRYLGLPGDPVEWIDRYFAHGTDWTVPDWPPSPVPTLAFASYQDRIGDLGSESVALPKGATPFAAHEVHRDSNLIFNVADYGHTLIQDFRLTGGGIVRREFASPAEFALLDEKVVINCPGYGARALMADETITPVRGQIGWLPPQPEARYAAFVQGISLVSRRDGIVVQDLRGGDMRGYGDADETPRRAESEDAVRAIAPLFAKFGGARA